jgi:hypothetical protein
MEEMNFYADIKICVVIFLLVYFSEYAKLNVAI